MKTICITLMWFLLFAKISSGQIILERPAEDETISNLPPQIRSFMELPVKERRRVFDNQNDRIKIYESRSGAPYPFTWKNISGSTGSFKLEISREPDFLIASQTLITKTWKNGEEYGADVSNFEIGKTFYWRVILELKDGTKILSPTREFQTDPFPLRLIDLPNVTNTRDIGGRPGLGGRMIRQGMIYRSSGLNEDSPDFKDDSATWNPPNAKSFRVGKPRITSKGIDYVLDVLRWRTELDLRSNGEVGAMEGSPVGPKLKWIHRSSPAYAEIFQKRWAKVMADNFKVFLDTSNYPIDFHCISGADRTGSLAFVLEGVLGVTEDELEKDWELSAQEPLNYKNRFDPLINGFNKYGSSNTPLVKKIESYLHSIGITEEEINKFRDIMLESNK